MYKIDIIKQIARAWENDFKCDLFEDIEMNIIDYTKLLVNELLDEMIGETSEENRPLMTEYKNRFSRALNQ